MLLLKEKVGSKPVDSPSGGEARSPAEDERRFLCRACESMITDGKALFCMRASTVEQVFPNPFGQMRVIVTVRWAQSIALDGEATSDFTWFAGYSWRIAYCAQCRAHLGWIYEATADATPRSFYGLLLEALIER
jgi:hypothetical protein